MDVEGLTQGLGYIALGIAAWPVGKYMVMPFIRAASEDLGGCISKNKKEVLQSAFSAYGENCGSVMVARSEVAIKLGEAGRSSDEISSILEESFPLPERPSGW